MNKYSFLFFGCLFFSCTCFAYTSCSGAGGTEITAKDGKKFCKSNALMSWYAAHAWCHANGGIMATLETACPGTTSIGSDSCPNLHIMSGKINVFGFLNKTKGTQSFARVNLINGATSYSTPFNRAIKHSDGISSEGEYSQFGGISDMYALCE